MLSSLHIPHTRTDDKKKAQSAAPETHQLLGEGTRMQNSHESGQMIVNKKRHWNALWLNLFMNSHNKFFYPLTVSYMGLGDKELLPFAIASLEGTYGLVPHGPDHVGVRINERIFGNTMLQYTANGEPLFLHANLGKWTTNVPSDPSTWIRRWQVSALHGEDIVDFINRYAGTDLERWIYDLLREQGCLFKATSERDQWLDNIGIGPLLEGMFLSDHWGMNSDLQIAQRARCVPETNGVVGRENGDNGQVHPFKDT